MIFNRDGFLEPICHMLEEVRYDFGKQEVRHSLLLPPPKGSGTLVAMKQLADAPPLSDQEQEQLRQDAAKASEEADEMDQEAPLPETDPKASEAAKQEGNALFKQGGYRDAIQKYDDALTLDGENASAAQNQAMCYLKLEQHAEARAAADLVLWLTQGANPKAWFRRGCGALGLGDWTSAMFDLMEVLKFNQN